MTEKPTYEELEQRIALLKNEPVKQWRMGTSIWEDEKIMRAFLDIPNTAAFLVDRNAILLYANETLAKRFSTNISELIGKCIWDIFPPDVSVKRKLIFETVLQNKKQVSHEDETQGRWNESIITPILDDSGEVEKIAVVGFDITERKRAQEILKEIITKNPMPIQILDKEGCTLEVNPSYKSLFGSVPPPDYSIFNDHQLLQKGMGKLFDQLRNGETVRFPELYFNAHDSLSELPDVPAWIRTIGFSLYGIGENLEKFVFMHENITEHKKSEEALQESERKYRSLFHNAQVALFRTSIDGQLVEINKRYAEIAGYDTVGDCMADYSPKTAWKDPESRNEFLKKIKKTGSVSDYEAQIVRKNGTDAWILFSATVYPDEGYIEGSIVNITDRKQMEEALQESELTFRKLFEESSDAILLIDETGVFVECNQAVLDLLKMTREQFLFLPLVKISPEYQPNGHKSKESSLEMIALAYKKGLHRFDWTCVNSQGGEFIVDVSLMPIVVKGKTMLHTTWRNITDRKQAEDRLRIFMESVENASDAVGMSTPEGRHYYQNKAFDELFGTIGEHPPETLYADPAIGYEVFKTIMGGGRWSGEVKMYARDRRTLTIFLRAYASKDSTGRITALVGVHTDITERKQAEAEKLIAQKNADDNEKMALVGQIAGKMAHDFNNILGIIMGNTELSLLDCKDDQIKNTLELIYEQTIRGKNLTKNLVAFAKDQEPKQEFFRINEKIDLVLNLMRKDLEGIELLKELSPGAPELLADPGMIEHALVNLIQNSIHALSMVEYPRITIRTYSRNNQICFEIEDNGCGISKENLEHIYEPSFSLKGSRDLRGSYKAGIKGTGYGMSNVKKYIELHKGSISVESELGSGTKFIISLPIIKKELTVEEKKEIRKGKSYSGKYILLVEDEIAIADVQYRILTQEPCNHKVDIANNGKVAMDLFGRNKYDLVSLDYVLPGNINGMDVYHHIRETNNTVPVLFISGNIEFLESIKDLKQQDRYIDHVSKPCKNIDYIGCINKMFASMGI